MGWRKTTSGWWKGQLSADYVDDAEDTEDVVLVIRPKAKFVCQDFGFSVPPGARFISACIEDEDFRGWCSIKGLKCLPDQEMTFRFTAGAPGTFEVRVLGLYEPCFEPPDA